jgi:hypothetical protein
VDDDRMSVSDAARETGVPGNQIFLAIKYGRISADTDEHGFSRVLVDEVRSLRDRAS